MKCPYCDGEVVFLESSEEIYNGTDYGPVWLCRECGARVGCHPGTSKPLGTLADAFTRAARTEAHAVFDPLWKEWGMGRNEAYRWLAGRLGIPTEDCHIGRFDLETCRRVIEECKEGEVL